jgi:hypothetical protein
LNELDQEAVQRANVVLLLYLLLPPNIGSKLNGLYAKKQYEGLIEEKQVGSI